MADNKELFKAEIERRSNMVKTLEEATTQMAEAKKQQKDLDDNFAKSQDDERKELVGIYRESRHYTGKEPRVYTESEVTIYPFYQGPADDAGNPYFRLSAVKAGDIGIAPLETPPTFVNGRWTRDRGFAPTEDVPRQAAANALQAYPNYSGEPLPDNWPSSQEIIPASCSLSQYSTQQLCTQNGGTWTSSSTVPDPVWVASQTAPELLRVPLNKWKQDLQQIINDTYHMKQADTVAYYNTVVAQIDTVLSLLPPPAVFVRDTGDTNPEHWGRTHVPLVGEPLYDAIQTLKNMANTGVPQFVTGRKQFLAGEAAFREGAFFTFCNMRLHNVNGSFAKYKAADSTDKSNKSIIEDHNKVIKQLNIMLTRP